jgi:NAD(P)-dependent dehydrogenase (short-subunit alcohol dehydrogenase family)
MDACNDKVAVITGGGSGIGRGLGLVLARNGARILLADIHADRVREAAADIHAQTGTRTLGVRTDVSDPTSVEALADAAYTTFGEVHILANNAGATTSVFPGRPP